MTSWCRKTTIFTRLNSHLSRTPNAKVPKSMEIPSCPAENRPPLIRFFGHHYATESTHRKVNGGKDKKRVDLEIIARESVKPASPTPHHLRTFSLSIIDQFMFGFYVPLILFLPNTDNISVSDVVKIRSRRLKESLSELLTQYYPFAGQINNNLHIECNDKGVYFVEARVNQTLEEFLRQPDDQKVRGLNPKHPSTTESSFGNYITSVQVNIFDCGGIGLSTMFSHKLVDGHSYFTFMKAWAATARGSSETISPSFMASKVFPNNPSFKNSPPSKFMTTKILSTKRFVFDPMALASLKSQPVACIGKHTSLPSRGPTRTEATTALIWKAAAKAASTVRPFCPNSPHALFSLVNLRKRASPPFPDESIGNIIDGVVAICFPKKQLELSTLMGLMRESIAKINSDQIESLKGEKGHTTFNNQLRALNELSDVLNEGDSLQVTSLLNSGMYEMDFGWGKPVWFYHMNPGNSTLVSLNDVVKGGGVEAIISLSSQVMEIFERDPEVLSYAAVDPSPLQFLN